MRGTLAVLGLAAGMSLVCCQTAGAVAAGAAAMKDATAAATAASTVQTAQYYERHTRHGIVKCYRYFVVGPYRCHYFRYW